MKITAAKAAKCCLLL